jgi:hypothetical protein
MKEGIWLPLKKVDFGPEKIVFFSYEGSCFVFP